MLDQSYKAKKTYFLCKMFPIIQKSNSKSCISKIAEIMLNLDSITEIEILFKVGQAYLFQV